MCGIATHTCRRTGELVGEHGDFDVYYCPWCDVEFVSLCGLKKGGDCCE